MQVFQIDYVRAVLEYALRKNADNTTYFNDLDIKIFSFYEHLVEDGEVQRYVETFKELCLQQNRQDLIGFGIVSTTNTPSIVNIKKTFISPFEWGCTIRCTLGNRDKMLGTLYDLFDKLKGRKVDVACLDNGKLFCVGTIGNNSYTSVLDYDYIGDIGGTTKAQFDTNITTRLSTITSTYGYATSSVTKVFCKNGNKLKLFEYKIDPEEDDETRAWIENIDFIPNHTSFEKYKIGLSFTDIKMEQPFTLDATEYLEITFGGGATLTKANVRLGNDLVKLEIGRNKIIGSTNGTSDHTFTNDNHILEPLEVGGGNSANSIENKLRSNYFISNSHTDSITANLQYTFVVDDEDLIVKWYNYAKYGITNNSAGNVLNSSSMTPNIIYNIKETYCSFGEIEQHLVKGKIVEDIDISTTDSDVMSISVSFQLQGDNN